MNMYDFWDLFKNRVTPISPIGTKIFLRVLGIGKGRHNFLHFLSSSPLPVFFEGLQIKFLEHIQKNSLAYTQPLRSGIVAFFRLKCVLQVKKFFDTANRYCSLPISENIRSSFCRFLRIFIKNLPLALEEKNGQRRKFGDYRVSQ